MARGKHQEADTGSQGKVLYLNRTSKAVMVLAQGVRGPEEERNMGINKSASCPDFPSFNAFRIQELSAYIVAKDGSKQWCAPPQILTLWLNDQRPVSMSMHYLLSCRL